MFKLIYPKFWQHRTLVSYLLWPLSQIYRVLGIIRYLLAKPVRFNAKVICIGNINVGGTGKTQIAIWLAEFLTKKNINFIVVTKGYRGLLRGPVVVEREHSTREVGDESILLAKYATVVVTQKIHKAVSFINKLNPRIIIVDDGMQNPNFHKDFCILTFDGLRGIGNEFLIPAGPLRQKFASGVKQSDAIIIFNKVKSDYLTARLKPCTRPLFSADTVSSGNELDDELNYFAFCSIGNPEKFFNTLQIANFKLINTKVFPDHHCYTKDEIETLIIEARRQTATLITTAKDYVKIPKEYHSNIKCLDTTLIIDKENELETLINEKIIY